MPRSSNFKIREINERDGLGLLLSHSGISNGANQAAATRGADEGRAILLYRDMETRRERAEGRWRISAPTRPEATDGGVTVEKEESPEKSPREKKNIAVGLFS